jgi:hypothetical protein
MHVRKKNNPHFGSFRVLRGWGWVAVESSSFSIFKSFWIWIKGSWDLSGSPPWKYSLSDRRFVSRQMDWRGRPWRPNILSHFVYWRCLEIFLQRAQIGRLFRLRRLGGRGKSYPLKLYLRLDRCLHFLPQTILRHSINYPIIPSFTMLTVSPHHSTRIHLALAEYLQYMLIRLGPVGASVPVWGKKPEIYNPKTAWNTVMKANQFSCSEMESV